MKKLSERVKKLHITLEQEIYFKLKDKAGDVPIAAYIRRLIKKNLS